MVRSKKPESKKPKSALSYVQRLLEDEYVQEQLRNAASGLRMAYARVRSRGGQAAEDKRLYGGVREAAMSMRRALTALQRPKSKPAPKPKRRFGKVAVVAVAAGGAALAVAKLGSRSSPSGTGASASSPGAGAPTPSTPASQAVPGSAGSTAPTGA